MSFLDFSISLITVSLKASEHFYHRSHLHRMCKNERLSYNISQNAIYSATNIYIPQKHSYLKVSHNKVFESSVTRFLNSGRDEQKVGEQTCLQSIANHGTYDAQFITMNNLCVFVLVRF